jgi:hypothetical protein
MNATQSPERRLLRPAALMAALSALGLTFTLMVGPALAVPEYATVTGYEPFSSAANGTDFWEDEFPGTTCESGGGDNADTYELPAPPAGKAYVAVIVKAGADNVDPYTNTIFAEPPTAGQTVWADTNGSGTFNEGDKQISHTIFCFGAAEESEEASTEESTEESIDESTAASVEESTEASVEGSVLGGTGTPAPSIPDGAMASDGPSPLPTIFFGTILLASLAGLAWVNVQAVRNRS